MVDDCGGLAYFLERIRLVEFGIGGFKFFKGDLAVFVNPSVA
jgi:hypothetical protein